MLLAQFDGNMRSAIDDYAPVIYELCYFAIKNWRSEMRTEELKKDCIGKAIEMQKLWSVGSPKMPEMVEVNFNKIK